MRIVRLALIAGVMMFGVALWFLRRDAPSTMTPFLSMAFYGVLAAQLVGVIMLRAIQGRASTFTGKARAAVIGWSIAESGALFGGVIWIMGGHAMTYLAGCLLFLVALLIIPAPKAERPLA